MLKAKTDFEIIDLVKTGSTQAFSELYDRYVNLVYSKCYDFVKNKEEAEDLTHEIFIKVHSKINTFDNYNFLGWISRFTYNACVDDFRKTRNNSFTKNSIDIENIDVLDDIADDELFKIKYEQLLKILEEIDVIDKEILILKYKEELPIKEIGELFKLSNSAVKMKINRAKKRIIEIHRIKYKSKVG